MGHVMTTRDFLGQNRLTNPMRRLITDLRQLTAESDVDVVSRVYASAVHAASCQEWAQGLGLRRSTGHPCLGRLRDGRCTEQYAYQYGQSTKHRIPCRIPGADHDSLWLKNGKPVLYVTQPYHWTWETMQEAVAFGQFWGLAIDVEPWPSWHFPGRVLTILVRKES
jgi:hypothetical protein